MRDACSPRNAAQPANFETKIVAYSSRQASSPNVSVPVLILTNCLFTAIYLPRIYTSQASQHDLSRAASSLTMLPRSIPPVSHSTAAIATSIVAAAAISYYLYANSHRQSRARRREQKDPTYRNADDYLFDPAIECELHVPTNHIAGKSLYGISRKVTF